MDMPSITYIESMSTGEKNMDGLSCGIAMLVMLFGVAKFMQFLEWLSTLSNNR